MDGTSNVMGSGLGIILKPPIGNTIRQPIKTSKLTNNEAEYKAMIVGLDLLRAWERRSSRPSVTPNLW